MRGRLDAVKTDLCPCELVFPKFSPQSPFQAARTTANCLSPLAERKQLPSTRRLAQLLDSQPGQDHLPFVRVCPIPLRVFAAFLAAARRFADPLLFAASFICAETAREDTVRVLSRLNAFIDARALLRELSEFFTRLRRLRVFTSLAPGLFGFGGSFTPAFRAFDNPIAIACCTDRAPCLPSRT